MTKSKIYKKQIIPFLFLLTLVLLGTFNLSSIYAIEWEGDGATFDPDDDYPTQYGAFIPQPNMFATMSIDGSNQGRFAMMNWLGGEIDSELINFPGTDISHLYPWTFDNYVKETPTNNDYIDPWLIDWMNVTAYNPHDVNLSSCTLNSIFNYHEMAEGGNLNVPVESGIPMQIDLLIEGKGPKVLKFDWLTDDPGFDPLGMNDLALVSPSGELVDWDKRAVEHNVLGMGSIDLFYYIAFVAHEVGTYRLLVKAGYSKPMSMTLEFLNLPITGLSLDKLIFGGNSDNKPTTQDYWDIEWQGKWFKINGKKGDVFKLDLGIDYGSLDPIVNFWLPCENGYESSIILEAGSYDIFFPTTGAAYISFIDETVDSIYRYSLFLSEIEVLDYIIESNLTTVRVDRNERKVIQFEVEHDTFVRFNYTLFPQPAGKPKIYAPGEPYGFVYLDSNKLEGYDIISTVNTKIAGDNETFYYYYLPAGTYKAFIANNDVEYDGVVQISSKFVDFSNITIPINSLTYPDTYATNFLTLEFDPNESHNTLYDGKYVYLNITEPGQYILNTTIYASDYLAAIPLSANPSAVIFWNQTAERYEDFTSHATTLNKSFPVFANDLDYLYIAYHSKWHDMHFNFSQFGDGGNIDNQLDVYDGEDWIQMWSTDNTGDFSNNGSWVNDIYGDTDFLSWKRGCDFEIPTLNEEEYYWLRFDCINDYSGGGDDIPFIDLIQLSNITLTGDVNFALIGNSNYDHCDFWNVTIGVEPSNLMINREQAALQDSQDTTLFVTNNPYTIGFEEGLYKLLIVPHGWGYQGTLKIDIAVENHWLYKHQQTYNISAISPEPNLYINQIKNLTAYGYSQDNITFYNYGLITTYNDTEVVTGGLDGVNGYYLIECFGEAYQWTQLIVSCNNVTEYELYLLQDLPWINNLGPNGEEATIATAFSPLTANATYEFGVLTDHFYLLFEVIASAELVTFRIDLNQYNTTILTTSIPIASYSPPFESGPLILGLVIGIPVAAGIIVVVYILKKKGRILTKHPG